VERFRQLAIQPDDLRFVFAWILKSGIASARNSAKIRARPSTTSTARITHGAHSVNPDSLKRDSAACALSMARFARLQKNSAGERIVAGFAPRAANHDDDDDYYSQKN
jgi:hypothetical protein